MLGTSLNDGGWPGPLRRHVAAGDRGAASAVLDEVWTGPEGFVALLAVRMGFATPHQPSLDERAASLVRRWRDEPMMSAPWSASLRIDPLGTARSLLQTREALFAAGVDDDTPLSLLPPRLAALFAATRGCFAGYEEQAAQLARAAEQGWSARVQRVEFVDDLMLFSVPVRRLLQALRREGTEVLPFQSMTANTLADVPHSDLARARALLSGQRTPDDWTLRGDGSLVLLRHDNVDDVAAEVAAFLADHDRSLIVSPHGEGGAVLDEALARRGAPTLGVRGGVEVDALLAILPLCVAVADVPVDPRRLFDLCSLPLSPLPTTVADALRKALGAVPSPYATSVRRAVDDAIASLWATDDHGALSPMARAQQEELRRQVVRCVPALEITPTAASLSSSLSSSLSTEELHRRLLLVSDFLQERAAQHESGFIDHTPYQAALVQVTNALRLLTLLGPQTLSAPDLRRVLQAAVRSAQATAPHAAAAGFAVVDDPGGVLGPTGTIVWWDFAQKSSAPRAFRAFRGAEALALRDAGFEPPSPDDLARAHARHQRRPLDAAVERLVLCCPRRGADGRELHPPALWDELLARLPNRVRLASSRAVVRPEEGQPDLVARVAVSPGSAPLPRRAHHLPDAGSHLAPRDDTPWTAACDAQLLGCGVHFALARQDVLEGPRQLRDDAVLGDDVVRALVGVVCRAFADGAPVTKETACDLVEAHFFDVVVERAAGWLLPSGEPLLARARHRAALAASELVAFLVHNDFTVRAVGERTSKRIPWQSVDAGNEGSFLLESTPDLVLSGPRGTFVVRFVTDHEPEHRRRLAAGTAFDLVVDAVLAGAKGKAWPGFGFFSVRNHRMWTTEEYVQRADVVTGPGSKEAWVKLHHARRQAVSALKQGVVVAHGVPDAAQVLSAPRSASVAGGAGVAAADTQGARTDPPSAAVVASPSWALLPVAPPCASCRADVVCGRAFVPSARRERLRP